MLVVAGTGAGALLLGVFLTSVVCCFVVKSRSAKFNRSAKAVEVPSAVNELCVKKQDDFCLPSRLPQDDYVHIYDHVRVYDHVFEVSTNGAYAIEAV